MAEWIELVDPTEHELHDALPSDIHERALELLVKPAVHDDEPRPRLEGRRHYVLGVFLVPVCIREEDRVFYQEVDFVATRERLIVVRKTPQRGYPFDDDPARESAEAAADDDVGLMAYRLTHTIAEYYLDLVDALNDEIDERCSSPSTAGSTGSAASPSAARSWRHSAASTRARLPVGDGERRGYAEPVPYYICPNCKERSIDHDRREGLSQDAVSCHHCGFGFLFELLEDYYPAPGTGFVVCDGQARVLAAGRDVFELSGYREEELMGRDVMEALGLSGLDGQNPAQVALEWGVRRMGEQLELRTRVGHAKAVTADFFPAYDEDGGLLVAITPR